MEEQTPNTAPPEEQEPTFEESFQILYAATPKPIQKFLQEKRYEEVSTYLAHTYGLNIKQREVLSQGLVFLLLGAQSPQDFSESLIKKLVLTEEVSAQITSDINKLVFVPLQTLIQSKDAESSTVTTQNTQTDKQSDYSYNKDSEAFTAKKTTPATEEKVTKYTAVAPPTVPIPLHAPTKSSSPIVKEYSIDPYRESTETS